MEGDGREEVSWIVGSEGMDRGEDWSGDRSGRNGRIWIGLGVRV
jgi:hypothetical protein